MRWLLIAAGILIALPFQRPQATGKDLPWLDPPRVEVEHLLKVSNEDEASHAEARGQLALAAGKMRKAAAEFRAVVAYRQAQLEALRARQGRICDPNTLNFAEGELAIARVGLAEAEGKLERLAELLPTVIHYYQTRITFVTDLLQLRVIEPKEAEETLRPLVEAVRRARKRREEVRLDLQRHPDDKGKAPGSLR